MWRVFKSSQVLQKFIENLFQLNFDNFIGDHDSNSILASFSGPFQHGLRQISKDIS